jgi:FKBP-type peptidyl-prolyl cis-trans isomerase
MKKSVAFLLAIVLLSTACKRGHRQDIYTKHADFYFKLLSIGEDKKKKDPPPVMWIDACCSTLEDSIFWDSRHDAEQGLFVRRNTFSFAPHLFGFSAGDSLEYVIPAKKFFLEFFRKDQVAFFSEKDSSVRLRVKILGLLSNDEAGRIADSLKTAAASRQATEQNLIEEYVASNFKDPVYLSSGVYMEKLNETNFDPIKAGNHLLVRFKGTYLDGHPVDVNFSERPFEFVYGQEGQVIEGLRLAFATLKKGEKAKIILPSQLAFGRGGGAGGILSNTPLLYEVEVVDVN